MTNKNISKKKNRDGIVIFVEGDTEKIFYRYLIDAIKLRYNSSLKCKIIIENLRGYGNFSFKAPNKFKRKILKDNPTTDFTVFCAYDTDVFKYKGKPPINWAELEKSLKKNGAKDVFFIKAETMIEDWFLKDIEGLCRYLKIPTEKVTKLKGNDANEKMQSLFMKGNKIYQKGSYTHNFIISLNFTVLINDLESELSSLIDFIKTLK